MMKEKHQLHLTINSDMDYDVREMIDLTYQLRRELLAHNIESVDFLPAEKPPPGAKVVEPITWGALVIGLASGGTFAALVTAINSWLSRHERLTVRVEIDGDVLELTGASSTERQKLIDLWVERRMKAEPTNDNQ